MSDYTYTLLILLTCSLSCVSDGVTIRCVDLLPGQYWCKEPTISLETQSAVNCSESNRTVTVPCYPVEGTVCNDRMFNGNEMGFKRDEPCFYV
jgi:hypothetical protein